MRSGQLPPLSGLHDGGHLVKAADREDEGCLGVPILGASKAELRQLPRDAPTVVDLDGQQLAAVRVDRDALAAAADLMAPRVAGVVKGRVQARAVGPAETLT